MGPPANTDKEVSTVTEDKNSEESTVSSTESAIWKMETTDTFRLAELNDKNWKCWAIKLQAYFEIQDLWDVIGKAAPADHASNQTWIKKNMKALNLIKLRVSDKYIGIIGKCVLASDAFKKLKEHFEGSGSSKMVLLFDRFYQLKTSPPASIAEFASEFSLIRDEIEELAVDKNEYYGYYFLHLLPERYQQAATSLKAAGNITFEKARDFLLQEERQAGASEVTLAGMARKNFGKKKMSYAEKLTKYPCHKCGKKGHFRKDCTEETSQNGKEDKSNTKSNNVLGGLRIKLNNVNTPAVKSVIYHDSGANDHMCNNRNWFANMKQTKGNVILPNGYEEPIVGIGDIHLCETEDVVLTLKDVKFVPGLHANYICEYNLMRRGLLVKPSTEKTVITTESGQIVATAERINGLLEYTRLRPVQVQLNASSIVENNINCVNKKPIHSKIEDTVRLWHERLGHLNFGDLSRLYSRIGIKEKLSEHLQCEACLLGKAHSRPFGRSKIRTKRVLELVHSDISGKISIANPHQYAYFMVLIDDYSRYTTVYLLREKSEVFKYFKQYKSMMENRFNTKIATLRSDNGTEYRNRLMEDFCKEQGIHLEHTVPHRPQQNGVSERMNRTLDDMARSLLIGAKLPKSFWPEAIQTAAHLRNLCPVSTNKFKIPYELWNERKYDYSHLAKFGSVAYALKLPSGGKFDAKSEKMIFVGYSEDAKAYKLYDPSKKKTIVSRDVEFIEKDSDLPNQESMIETNEEDYVTLQLKLAEDDSPNENTLEDTVNNPIEQVTSQESNAEETSTELTSQESSAQRQQTTSTSTLHQEVDNVTNATNPNTGTKIYLSSNEYIEYVQNHRGVQLKRIPGAPQLIRGQRGPPIKKYHYQVNSIQVQPTTFEEISMSDESENWQQSMQAEYLSHIGYGTWTLVPKPEKKKVLDMKWVYKVKTDEEGNTIKYKSRLCIKGCSQKYGVDYEETFAPVIRHSGIRFLLTVALKNDSIAHHVDIETAYLNSDIEEEIFVHQPKGFEVNGKEHLVCKLNKAVYGLKQAARQWNLKLKEVMKKLHFKPSESEPCIFQNIKHHNFMVGVYVDDLIVIGREDEVQQFKKDLASLLRITDKGELRFCLNMQVDWNHDSNTAKVSQKKFILGLLEKYGKENCKPADTPVATGTIFEKATKLNAINNVSEYQSLIGSLLYVANCTRPDISFAVSKLCQYMSAPSNVHMNVANRILAYLKKTVHYGLLFRKGNLHCSIFADADFGNDLTEGKSMSGVMTFVGSNLIDWHCSKQSMVALSTCEAEITAIVEGARFALYMRGLLSDFGFLPPKQRITIWNDNQSAEKTLTHGGQFKRTRHYARRFYFVKDYISRKMIDVDYWQTEFMPADALTKPLSAEQHNNLMEIYNVGIND